MNIEAETTLDKPPQVVYDFLLDKENLILWLTRFNQYINISGEADELGSEAWYIFGYRNTKVKFYTRVLSLNVNQSIHTLLKNKWVKIILKVNLYNAGENGTLLRMNAEYIPRTLLFRLYWILNSHALRRRHQNDMYNLGQILTTKNDVLGLV